MDKDRALAVANAFKSKNVSFIHVMKESHMVGGGWPNVVSCIKINTRFTLELSYI